MKSGDVVAAGLAPVDDGGPAAATAGKLDSSSQVPAAVVSHMMESMPVCCSDIISDDQVS